MIKIKYTLILLLSIALSYQGFAQKPSPKQNQKDYAKALDLMGASMSMLNRYFVDSVNIKEISEYGLNSMLQSLDPYTEFYSKEDNERLKLMTTGEYGGIGAIIMQRPDSSVLINEPMEGMPADLAGLRAGDRILEIDEQDFRKSTSEAVTKVLKGKPNSKLTLLIERLNEKKPLKISFKRQKIHLNAVPYFGTTPEGFGYIALSSFTSSAGKEVKSALKTLIEEHNIKGLVLDLRNNGGGLLDEAVKIVNFFVPKDKLVVSTKARPELKKNTVQRTTQRPIAPNLPLVVLVNGSSASASEIVSGSLQDMDRAVIIGEKTFGKGLVQTTLRLPHEAILKLTTAKYYIPSGRCIQKIDYRTRKNGRGGQVIPDSLAKTFYTELGRPVKDNGGIMPDITIKRDTLATMLYYLTFEPKVFDWVTAYSYKHKTIQTPKTFKLSDEDYQAFGKMLKEAKFNYDRQSSKVLKELKSVAKLEGYYPKTKALFDSLELALTPNLDHDLQVLKKDIKKLLESKILTRYYYKRGAIERELMTDKFIQEAEQLLANPNKMKALLSLPQESKEEQKNKQKQE